MSAPSAPPPATPLGRAHILSAALWVGVLLGITRAAGTIQSIFIARSFEREEVGLLSIMALLSAAIQAFTETGHEAALIQRREEGLARAIDTAWVGAIVRGVLLCAVLALLAGPVADFYEDARLVAFIRGSALYFLIIGFKNLHLVRESREMRFRGPKLLSAAATLGGLAVTVVVGLWSGSLWCVVAGGIAMRLIEATGSHLITRERARLRFNKQDFLELFRYGKSIQLTAILVFLITQIDNAVVGKVISLSALAVYNNAYTLANLPMTQVVGIASQVAFPAWSKVAREGSVAQRNAMFLSTTRFTAALSIALTVGLFIGGADLVEVIFGEKWRDVESPMRILLLFGVWRGVASNFGALFNSMGRPDLIAREITLKFIAVAALIYPMTERWGVEGAAWAVTLPMCLITPVALWIYLGVAQIDRREALDTLKWPLLGAGLVSQLWWYGEPMLRALPVWTRGLLLPALSIVIIGLLCWSMDPQLRQTLRREEKT
jgi:O-antigen/teichoic acid export membrane protein